MASFRCALAVVLGAAFAQALHAAPENRAERHYIVHYRSGQAGAAQRALVRRGTQVRHRFERRDAAALVMDEAEAARLARDPAIAAIEQDAPRYPVSMLRSRPSGADLPSASATSTQVVPYGVRLIDARPYQGDVTSGIRTCVIDSGYDLGHADKPGKQRVTGSNDIGGAGPWNRDGNGHGTHVSGTINARNNSFGVVGVFPGAPMHVVRVFGNNGGWAYSSDLVAALDKCLDSGSRVVSMSLGGAEQTTLERNAFAAARTAGVLSFAAAGNDGNATMSYPASYASVLSVAAVDDAAVHAPFSNANVRVALAAPGVSVLSTVPRGTVAEALVRSGLGTVSAIPMDFSVTPSVPVSARLANCGLAATAAACTGAQGRICLIERGDYTFAVKAQSCKAAGGVGAVVFNRGGQTGPVYGTLGAPVVNIPVVGIDRATGLALRADYLGTTATLEFGLSEFDYDYYSGTSMATPHAAAAAAIIWSRHPNCSNLQIEGALTATAQDLGAPGRDPQYGYGLVQVRAASTRLDDSGCNSAP